METGVSLNTSFPLASMGNNSHRNHLPSPGSAAAREAGRVSALSTACGTSPPPRGACTAASPPLQLLTRPTAPVHLCASSEAQAHSRLRKTPLQAAHGQAGNTRLPAALETCLKNSRFSRDRQGASREGHYPARRTRNFKGFWEF